MQYSRRVITPALSVLVFAAGAGAAIAQPAVGANQPSAQTGEAQIQEVVVTAQRRGERLLEVPATVTVLSGQQLAAAAVQNTLDLTKAVPGLTMTTSTVGAQPTIRGIGARSVSTGNEPNVATYVDGVYQAQPFANLFELNDIDSIKVLKGPQGTLYGRNATGGAILVTTKRPSFTPTGEFSASYGTDDYRKATAYISGPIVGDSLAGSLSVIEERQDGYIRNLYLGEKLGSEDLSSIRAKLLWRVNDRVELGLNAFNAISDNNANPAWHALNGNTVVRTLPNPLNIPLDVRIPQNPYETAAYFHPFMKLRAKQYDGHAKVDLDWAELNAVVAYKQDYSNFSQDSGGATVRPIAWVQDNRPYSRSLWTEETLTSQGNHRLSWIAGVNGFADLSETHPQIALNIVDRYGIRTRAASGFVEATYKITDEFSATAGLRYNWEHKEAFFHQLSPVGPNTSGSRTFEKGTPRFVLKYQPNPDLNLYASYTEGFKSGGFAADSAAGATNADSVGPEVAKAFEVGVKSRPTPRLLFDADAFHYNYEGLQVLAVVATSTSLSSILTNAARAEIYGGESNFDWSVTDHLQLRGGVALLHTEFTSFPNATVIEQKPLVNGLGVGNMTVSGVNLEGKELIRAPKYTANIELDHHIDLWGGQLSTTLAYFVSAKYWADVNNRVAQPAYGLFDASIAWRSPNNVTLSLTGKNLTSAKLATQIFENNNGDFVTYIRPAQVYAAVTYDF